jgi:hypothetical protein
LYDAAASKNARNLQKGSAHFSFGFIGFCYGNTAQFPPYGLSTAPTTAARHLRCQNAR